MYDAKLLREILDAQLEMVCRFRRDGTILFVNRAYAQSLGHTPAELTGNSLWQFVTADDRADVEAQLGRISPECNEITIENRFETLAGARWVLWRNHGLEFDGAGNLLVAQSTGIDITDRKQLEEQRQLLIDELNHRVRNTLTVVQGMAYQSFRSEDFARDALDTFNARLHALAGAHTALSNSSWVGAELGGIVGQALALASEGVEQVTAEGPPVTLRPSVAVALALVFHELATNALKYGALSTPVGRLDVRWMVDDGHIRFDWRERCGPTVQPPTRRGFGSRLLESSIRRQLAGTLVLDYAPEGVTCRFGIPLDHAV